MVKKPNDLPIIGWREWLKLPKLDVSMIKAKIDTGARTSSLHAHDMTFFKRGNVEFVKFSIHPIQKNDTTIIQTNACVIEKRSVKDSGGKTTVRPVILTPLSMGKFTWDIELTLVNRDEMGFRMLLGRQAVRNRFFIHPGKSFLIGKKERKI